VTTPTGRESQALIRLHGSACWFESQVLRDPIDEGRAVLREPAGLRRHEPCPDHLLRGHLVAADAQGVDSPLDGVLAQAVAVAQSLPEAHDAREGVHHPKPVMGRLGDEKAAVVGPEIEGRIGVAVPAPPAEAATGPPLRPGRDGRDPRRVGIFRVQLRNGFVLNGHSTIPKRRHTDRRPPDLESNHRIGDLPRPGSALPSE
jgi:hypothetical protein